MIHAIPVIHAILMIDDSRHKRDTCDLHPAAIQALLILLMAQNSQ